MTKVILSTGKICWLPDIGKEGEKLKLWIEQIPAYVFTVPVIKSTRKMSMWMQSIAAEWALMAFNKTCKRFSDKYEYTSSWEFHGRFSEALSCMWDIMDRNYIWTNIIYNKLKSESVHKDDISAIYNIWKCVHEHFFRAHCSKLLAIIWKAAA